MLRPGAAGPQGYYRSQDDYPSAPGYPSPADYPSRGGYPGQGSRGEQGGPGRRARPQAPWDGGLPEPDPELRYREPGPGMPGYRGPRDHRYGGETR